MFIRVFTTKISLVTSQRAAVPSQQVQDVLPHVVAAGRAVVHQFWGEVWPPGSARGLCILDPVNHSVLVVQAGQIMPQH